MLALPALIFRAVTTGDLGDLNLPYLVAYLAGSLATLGVGYGLGRRSGLDGAAASFQAMGMSCANSGFIGYPALLLAMPALADRALAMNVIVENLLVLPLILLLAEAGRGGSRAQVLTRVAASPILIGLVAGLAVALSGVVLPEAIDRAVDLVARSSTAVSLLVIGGTLVGIPRVTRAARIAPIVAGKLLLHPLAVAAAFALLAGAGDAVDPDLARAGILMAAMPAMGVYTVLAAQYGEGPTAAVAMLVMTVLSFLTLSALLWALGFAT